MLARSIMVNKAKNSFLRGSPTRCGKEKFIVWIGSKCGLWYQQDSNGSMQTLRLSFVTSLAILVLSAPL